MPKRVVRGAAEHKWLILATVLVCAVIFLTSFLGTTDRERINAVATETHAALCAFKLDLRERQRGTNEYLRSVDDGERVLPPGITRGDIVASRNRSRATLRSLSHLDCTDIHKEDMP